MQDMSEQYYRKNELMHHRKREHPSNVACKYFLKNLCRRSNKCGKCCTRCVRTTATNGDHDARAETPTAATATAVPGAYENDDDPDDEHEYVNTKTDKNIESKMSHSNDTVNHVQNLCDTPIHLVNACQNCHRHTFSPMILWSLLNLRPKVSIMDNGHNEDF